MVRLIRFGIALAAALACWPAGPAGAASLLEMNFWLSGPRYEARVPPCEDAGMLYRIRSRFAEKEKEYWQSDLQILGFERIHETSFRPWTGAPDAIPRRYCSGTALISDGRPRTIHFWYGEDTGWLGVMWGVEWCVVGLDRNWAYNPGCRMAQP